MDSQITEVLNVTREASWLPWAVQYFFLIGLSYASFMLTLPYFVFGRAHLERLGRLSLLAALACGVAAPVALLADLHGPGRFYHFYLYFQPRSWMAWGSFFIPLYLGGLLLYAWLALRPDLAAWGASGRAGARWYRLAGRGGRAPRGALAGAAALTMCGVLALALYTGMEVAVVRARPLWHTPFLPAQFVATAAVGALGLALLFNRYLGAPDRRLELALNRALALSLALVLALGGGWLYVSLSGLSPVHSAAFNQVAGAPAWQFSAVWAVLATVAPMALAVWRPATSGLFNGIVALHSAWMMRWTIFIGGQAIPKTGAGLYDYQLPLGSDGLLGIAGTLGLWVVLLIVMLDYLPWAGAKRVRPDPADPVAPVGTAAIH